jgi:hypothetical protein
VLALAAAVGADVVRAEDQPQQGSIELLSQAVDEELTDVAGALRQIDQSFVYRGFQGCGSATAGSVHIDWEAKGIPADQRVRVLPPQPLVLSRSTKQPCNHPQDVPAAEPQPTPMPAPAPKTDCPCHQRVISADPVPTQPAPLLHSDDASGFIPKSIGPSFHSDGIVESAPASTYPQVFEPKTEVQQPAEIYYHGRCINGSCGGRTPPHAVMVNGRWTEAPSVGCGRTSYSSIAPGVRMAPSAYASPVW